MPGIVAVASCVAYYFVMSSGRAAVLYKTLPPVVGAWLPNLAFVAAIVLATRRTTNAERHPCRLSAFLSFDRD